MSQDVDELKIAFEVPMAAKKKLQIFVSSTYLDLKVERQAAVEAILKAGHIPAGMELFSAGNDSQLDTIRRWIDESDVYMLILGGRYGSVDPVTSLSYTELEYDYAVSKGKPTFSVVITEGAIDQKVKRDGKAAIETERPQELKQFREKVLRRISKFFDEPKDIELSVLQTISDFVNRHEFTGWVSGSEVASSSMHLEEMSRLRKRNQELETELAQLNAAKVAREPTIPDYSDNDKLGILISWMGQRDHRLNRSVIHFAEVDQELKLPAGTTKQFIEAAAQTLKYVVRNKGEHTILFAELSDTEDLVASSRSRW